ncbi:MAG: hypothetical protein KAT56_03070, partial [Sedimentisphaerales bacterium]|nr:hypothetical protein [Sedimentisphaerales bacterium]
PLAFSGDSLSADQTIVVATLDSPVPKGKNVIWCVTFQACWNELKTVVGPMDVPGARDMVRRLNEAPLNADDLPEGGYYAAAGLVTDGIVKKIKSEMAARFPNVKPNLPSVGNEIVAVAYAYLSSAVKFRTAYFDREGGDNFIDSSGNRTRISSFGLYKNRESSVNATLARQIEVLYSDKKRYPSQEFVLDLDKNSRPTQLILACVEPKESLAATWQKVQRKMRDWNPGKDEREFGDHDSLAVPNVNYRLRHIFKELETSDLLRTSQVIEFRLDRSGAGLASEAYIAYLAAGRSFSFIRPFLIVLRKRGSAEPYFVMWVDNAELLCKITN